jgi:hypothetical protein
MNLSKRWECWSKVLDVLLSEELNIFRETTIDFDGKLRIKEVFANFFPLTTNYSRAGYFGLSFCRRSRRMMNE